MSLTRERNDLTQLIEELLNIGIALSAEKDHNKLLEMILTEARRITRADAGTLYFYEDDKLIFKIIHNKTLGIFKGGGGEPVDLPPVPISPGNVSAWVAINKKSVNIPDVYNAEGFDFSGPKRYDAITGYNTRSMLVVPLENYDGEVIGVLQLINAMDKEGKILSFEPYLERMVLSLASQAAVAITNMQYIEEINRLFHSFVQVMATAIDARTPYNVNHTRNIALLAESLALYIDKLESGPFASECFDIERIAQLVMAAWLHDIGKVAVPLKVMDKPSRLGELYETVMQRVDLWEAKSKVLYLEKKFADQITTELEEWWIKQQKTFLEVRELIVRANDPATFVNNDLTSQLQDIAAWQEPYSGERLLNEEELKCLCIQRGTLTDDERKIMESHVTVTQRMLDKIKFSKKLKDVPQWAIYHHEFMDGTGYPFGLKGKEIPLEARILTILDIFDALTASDRPYKKAMPPEKALVILENMAKEGKLDHLLVEIFIKSRVWEKKGGEL